MFRVHIILSFYADSWNIFSCSELARLFHVSPLDWFTESQTLLFFFSRAWRPILHCELGYGCLLQSLKAWLSFLWGELIRSIMQILHLREVQRRAHFEKSAKETDAVICDWRLLTWPILLDGIYRRISALPYDMLNSRHLVSNATLTVTRVCLHINFNELSNNSIEYDLFAD